MDAAETPSESSPEGPDVFDKPAEGRPKPVLMRVVPALICLAVVMVFVVPRLFRHTMSNAWQFRANFSFLAEDSKSQLVSFVQPDPSKYALLVAAAAALVGLAILLIKGRFSVKALVVYVLFICLGGGAGFVLERMRTTTGVVEAHYEKLLSEDQMTRWSELMRIEFDTAQAPEEVGTDVSAEQLAGFKKLSPVFEKTADSQVRVVVTFQGMPFPARSVTGKAYMAYGEAICAYFAEAQEMAPVKQENRTVTEQGAGQRARDTLKKLRKMPGLRSIKGAPPTKKQE